MRSFVGLPVFDFNEKLVESLIRVMVKRLRLHARERTHRIRYPRTQDGGFFFQMGALVVA